MFFLKKVKTGRELLYFTSIFVILVITLALVAGPKSAQAADPDGFSQAPLNPAFVEYVTKAQQKSQQPSAPGTSGISISSEPFYGYVPPTVDFSHVDRIMAQEKGNMKGNMGYPVAFDWRTYGVVTGVRNQNPCGTCWTFGNTAVMESRVKIFTGTTYDFSEQNVNCCTDPSWTALQADNCNHGGNDLIAQDTFIKKGTRLEAADPYDTLTINAEACTNPTTYYRTTNWRYVAANDNAGINRDAIKFALTNYGPMTLAYYADAFPYPHLYAGAKYYWPSCPNGANHLVTLIGWDDALAHPAGGGTGAWLAKNSWGAGWGNAGYFWLCYGSGNVQDFGCVQTVKAYDANETIYYWDEAGFVGGYGWGDTTGWTASIFQASTAGNLTHVDFYTTSPNAQYQIYVYNSGVITALGAAVATKTGTCAEMGYYSIPLAAPYALTLGQSFTVAVKMTTLGYNYPLGAEWDVLPEIDTTIQTGKCYAKHLDASAWYDMGGGGAQHYNNSVRARVTATATPPLAPTLLLPTNGANVTGTSITFSWNASAGATDYDLYILKSGVPFFDMWVGNVTSRIVTGFPNDGSSFSWVVKAQNSAGNSPWSSVRTFTNTGLPPTPPNQRPKIVGTSITFSWGSSTGATDYWLTVRKISDGTNLHWGFVGNVTSHVVTGFPNDGTAYKWQVFAYNATGYSSGANPWMEFTNGPP